MPTLDRQIITTSRDLDFLTKRELSAQTGYDTAYWAEVAVKELVDNALDACEDAGIRPQIAVTLDGDAISVTDNGPGIPSDVVTRIADYSTRTSSREAYAGLSRGAQGNAWMTLLAMPHALGGGHVTINSRGIKHRMEIKPHPLTGKIAVDHLTETSDVKNGTIVEVVSPRWNRPDFHDLLILIALANPTAHIAYNGKLLMPTTPPAAPRWPNNKPAPAHWYTLERFQRLLTARLATDPDLPLRLFLKDFDGMAGTARQKTVASAMQLSGARLDAFLRSDGSLGTDKARALHDAIQSATKPAKAVRLGRLGEAAMRRYCECANAVFLNYAIRKIDDDSEPAIVEVLITQNDGRSHVVMMNGTAPPAPIIAGLDRLFPTSLQETIAIRCIVNITCPAVTFADRGKRNVILPQNVKDIIEDAIARAAKPWTDHWKKQMRSQKEPTTIQKKPEAKMSIRDAAFQVMDAAYMEASSGGTLPAPPRMIMYAARGGIQRLTGKPLDSKYFTQTLLWDYIDEHPDQTSTWKIAVDPRGNLVEPHTGRKVPLGTLQVERYIKGADRHLPLESDAIQIASDIITKGPKFRFSNVLFCEKEGFNSIFDAANLSRRFDIGIMSTKGMSVTAARKLVDWFVGQGIRVFCIRDFDVTGFTIAGTLRSDTRRHEWQTDGASDLGLRLSDVEAMSLQSEDVFHKSGKRRLTSPFKIDEKIRPTLERYGATDAEVKFLIKHRVELNAMTSGQLISWIEKKLIAEGVTKFIPNDAALIEAATHFAKIKEANRILRETSLEVDVPDIAALRDAVTRAVGRESTTSWDRALMDAIKRGEI